MFRHQDNSRTLLHNLRIATVLSFVAGLVNVTGFFVIKELTSNVTGHFTYFIAFLSEFNYRHALLFFYFTLSFLSGSFISGLLIERFKTTKTLNIFVIPTITEAIILAMIPVCNLFMDPLPEKPFAMLLLFAMGLQNSYVTKISHAVVRTTHLTGLFTDLGIDLSQLLLKQDKESKKHLKSNIKLRLFIIIFFFMGGFSAGIAYNWLHWKANTFYIGSIILILSLFYDHFRYRIMKIKHQHKSKNS